MFQKPSKILFGLALVGLLGLQSCLTIPPHSGGFGYGSYTYPAEGYNAPLDQMHAGSKKGSACLTGDSIIPFVYHVWRGDASVRAAASNGGITKIKSINHEYRKPILGDVQICTVVSGD